jgi:hypothetical protein
MNNQLTEQQIDHLIESMPNGADGFLKEWGLRQFAHAVQHYLLTKNRAAWIEDRWVDARVPPTSDKGEHYPIQVLAVVDDPRLRINGEDPFIDIAAYWPALKKWTVTHCTVADETATDYEVKVSKWMPMPPIKGEHK